MTLIFEPLKCIDALNGGASCLGALSQLTVHVLSAFVALYKFLPIFWPGIFPRTLFRVNREMGSTVGGIRQLLVC